MQSFRPGVTARHRVILTFFHTLSDHPSGKLGSAIDAGDGSSCGISKKAQKVMTNYFRINGMSPGSSDPVERIVSTALEAEKQYYTLSRICGRSGGVTIYRRDGRTVSLERVSKVARDEENTPG